LNILNKDPVKDKKNKEDSMKYLEQKSIYLKKDSYKQRDFFEFYEGVRFSSEFMVYRAMGWWDFFDTMANLGHPLYASIVVLTGLFI
jgi:hypothetical protein